MATVTVNTIGTGGDYTTAAAWEAAAPANLVTADEVWRGELLNEEFVVSANFVTIAGQTTDATRFMELTVQAGASFADHADKLTNALKYDATLGAAIRDTGFYHETIGVTTAHTRLSRFMIKVESGSNYSPIVATGASCRIDGVLAEYAGRNFLGAFTIGGGSTIVRNSIGIITGTTTYGAAFHNTAGTNTYLNCLGIKPSNVTAGATAYQSAYSSMVIKNCGSFGFTTFYASVGGGASGSGSNNATNLASISFGTSNQTSLTYADQFVEPSATTGLDLRTKTGAALIDSGTDTSADGVTTDIVGTARGATYDIGAWEFASAAAYTLTLAAGSFTLTGQALALERGRKLALAAGSFALTGQAVALERGRRLVLAAGSFALSGQAIALRGQRRLALAAGSVALTGQALSLEYGRRLVLAAGSFAASGQALGLRAQRRLVLAAGSFALTGQAVDVIGPSARLSLAASSFAASGQALGLRAQRRLALAAGSFALTGQVIDLVGTAARLPLAAGSFALSGQAVRLLVQRRLALAVGACSLSGQAIALRRGRSFLLAAGSLAFTGQAIALRRGYRVALEAGAVALSGQALALTYSGATVYPGSTARTVTLPARNRVAVLKPRDRTVSLPARRFTVTLPSER